MTSPAPSTLRVGVYPGTFDPPHLGHLTLATVSMAHLNLDRLIVVPSAHHPAGKRPLATLEHRLRMCELNFSTLEHVEVSDVERTLPSPNYTLVTMQRLHQTVPTAKWFLLMGADTWSTFHLWHDPDGIAALAVPTVVGRGLPTEPPAPQHRAWTPYHVPVHIEDMSSSHIREHLNDDVPLPLAASVRAHVVQHQLYSASPR